jgi:hypothetical protein
MVVLRRRSVLPPCFGVAVRGVIANLLGMTFGRWTVVAPFETPKGKNVKWLCRCECGTERAVAACSLLSDGKKNSRSCGCVQRKHGMWRSPEYKTWERILSRCYNANVPVYADYGGRGIQVCERWRADFSAFLADMGPRPPGHSIDRLDVNGDYEPGNCRWATPTEQGRNRRNNRYVTIDGATATVAEWAERSGLQQGTILARLRSGWSGSRLLVRPLTAQQRLDCRWRKEAV